MNLEKIWQESCTYNIQQKKDEFVPLLKWLKKNLKQRKQCLNIGIAGGGTVNAFSYLFDHVTGVDIEFNALTFANNNIRLIHGCDSHSDWFKDWLDKHPYKFDCVFIDGDHSYNGGKQDYEVCKEYLAPGGVIIFHDIIETDMHKKYGCNIHKLWKDIRNNPQIYGITRSLWNADNKGQDFTSINPEMNDFNIWGGIGILQPDSYKKLELPDVTLICVATAQDMLNSLRAVKVSVDYCQFGRVRLLTNIELDNAPDWIDDIIKIPELKSVFEYSKFAIQELYKYVDTSHCLIIQHDGFVLNPNVWDNKWLKYDYLGAYTQFSNGISFHGNGGFCLRSRKLLNLVSTFDIPDGNFYEDEFICSDNFHRLINAGMKFLPTYPPAVNFFAVDGTVKWQGEFGFHNFVNTDISGWKSKDYYFPKDDFEVKPSDIDVVTLYTPEIKTYAVMCADSMDRYCEVHGYNFICYKERLSDRHPSWDKILAIQNSFAHGAKYVLWVDADAMVLDIDKTIESLFDKDKDIVIAADCNGLNAGVILFKKSVWTEFYLRKIWGMIHHLNSQWFEQSAMHELYQNRTVINHTKIIPQQEINGLFDDGFTANSFILHCAGMRQSLKYQIIKSIYSFRYNRQEATTALHSGNLGDIIYCLPIFKELNIKKIVLYKNPNPLYNMPDEYCEAIKPLLEHCGYEITITDNPVWGEVDYFMDIFREQNKELFTQHLSISQGEKFGVIPDLSTRYIPVDRFIEHVVRQNVVIARSLKYHNPDFNWWALLHNINDKILFLGTIEEYESFVKTTTLFQVEYVNTMNLLEAARFIARAKIFIGNQSPLFAIAEMLKTDRILETDITIPNCINKQSNMLSVTNVNSFLLAKQTVNEL